MGNSVFHLTPLRSAKGQNDSRAHAVSRCRQDAGLECRGHAAMLSSLLSHHHSIAQALLFAFANRVAGSPEPWTTRKRGERSKRICSEILMWRCPDTNHRYISQLRCQPCCYSRRRRALLASGKRSPGRAIGRRQRARTRRAAAAAAAAIRRAGRRAQVMPTAPLPSNATFIRLRRRGGMAQTPPDALPRCPAGRRELLRQTAATIATLAAATLSTSQALAEEGGEWRPHIFAHPSTRAVHVSFFW